MQTGIFENLFAITRNVHIMYTDIHQFCRCYVALSTEREKLQIERLSHEFDESLLNQSSLRENSPDDFLKAMTE